MPKRLIDGEALWGSEKLRRVEPPKYRAEYANLLPLALANGVFEADATKVWAKVYAFNRPKIRPATVEKILASFEQAGMLFRWKDEDGRVWGFWVGIDSRLPSKQRAEKLRMAVGPYPPKEGLKEYLLRSNSVAATQLLSYGLVRLGKGRLGKENPTAQASPSLNGFEAFWKAYPKKLGKLAAERSWKRLKPSVEMMTRMLTMIGVWAATEQWRKEGGQFIPYPATFLNQRRWEDQPPVSEEQKEAAVGSHSHTPVCLECGKPAQGRYCEECGPKVKERLARVGSG